MAGIIGSGKYVGRSTEPVQLERDHAALGREHHHRGQVRREVFGTVDDVVDRGPVADHIEDGVAHLMHRSLGAETVIQRIWILDRIPTKERDRIVEQPHSYRLTSMAACGQRAEQGTKTAPTAAPADSSHSAARTCGDSE